MIKARYKKQQKGNKPNKINNIFNIGYLYQKAFVLKSIEFGRISQRQIDTCRMTINKNLRKFGRLVINLQVNVPITRKPLEVRMGKGKGSVSFWACKVKLGTPLFTVFSNYNVLALNALRASKIKLPIRTKIVKYESSN